MKFIFEISISGKDWQSVHEQIFYDSLYRHANKITPLIKIMLTGKQLAYGNTQYKITENTISDHLIK